MIRLKVEFDIYLLTKILSLLLLGKGIEKEKSRKNREAGKDLILKVIFIR
ncbi:hypothetical protein [Clostridium tertium]|nr:hypothetical protein [Clostridium tertium]MBP1869423.1 hypothetical protein [Clostridium tertium]